MPKPDRRERRLVNGGRRGRRCCGRADCEVSTPESKRTGTYFGKSPASERRSRNASQWVAGKNPQASTDITAAIHGRMSRAEVTGAGHGQMSRAQVTATSQVDVTGVCDSVERAVLAPGGTHDVSADRTARAGVARRRVGADAMGWDHSVDCRSSRSTGGNQNVQQ